MCVQAKQCSRLPILPIAISLGLFSSFVQADLLVSGYQDGLHDPYYVGADKAFIGAGYDWSGVGRIWDPVGTSSNWKTLTMISDNYFITANHFKPNRGDDPAGSAPKVRFYRTLDPNGEYWESEIAVTGSKYDGQRIGLTDLWVGKLADTPPDWVMRYPLAKRHEATNYLSYTDNEIFVFGQDSPRSYSSLRVGRNEINQVELGGTYSWDYDPKNGLGADEAETQSGDSGSPSFYTTSAGMPVLAGIHTRTNFDTGVSTALQQIMTAVPEYVSVSTGLVGDIDGDFWVTARDFDYVLDGFGKTLGTYTRQADLTADGMVDVLDVNIFLDQFNSALFAPADFNRDGLVDHIDLSRIGFKWGQSVEPFGDGDANGDGLVNFADVEVFDDNQFRAFLGPLPPPLSPVDGDLTGNGVVDGSDLSEVGRNLGRVVEPGMDGDADGNGVVNSLDQTYVAMRIGTSFGDVNGDGEVGPLDFAVIVNNWNKKLPGGRAVGDLNGNGWVTNTDVYFLFQWWGQQNGEFPGMLVPEPTSLLLVGMWVGSLALLARRRIGRCV